MAVLAVFCISAVASATALAAPKGEIVNKSGVAPVKNKFTGSSTKAGKLETVAGSKIECTETKTSGTIESKTSGKATFTFTGCQTGGSKCKTGSETAGTVVVPVTLKPEVVSEKDYILNSVDEGKTLVISCTSLGVTIEVKGSLLIQATPENILKTEFEFNAKGSKGIQEPEDKTVPLEAKFSNSTSKAFEKASLSAEALKVKFEEEVEFI